MKENFISWLQLCVSGQSEPPDRGLQAPRNNLRSFGTVAGTGKIFPLPPEEIQDRCRHDSAHYKNVKNGVRVVSAKENITDRSEGIILESLREGVEEYYPLELSAKVICGIRKMRSSTMVEYPHLGLPLMPTSNTGSTVKQIANRLNDLGVITVRSRPVNLNFISGILHNRKYFGEYK